MKLLIIDTETTDINDAKVCEIAGTLYQVGENIRETGAICSISTVLPVTENPAEFVNGISPELTLNAPGWIAPIFVGTLKKMANAADYAIAFNAEFDAPLVDKLLNTNLNWLCAMKDFDWGYPAKNDSYKLTDLALFMGIGISTVHRTGDDVRLLVECFNRRKQILPEIVNQAIRVSQSPMIELKALVEYETRSLASNARFHWDGDRKLWTKKIRECRFNEFVKTLSFGVEVI
ncbi:MAG: 3'-5' exonuclease [Dolichospermum sp. DEX189]|jgi:DNA polymerase-3 subunit epsilon|uniref:3'-5' exonuclease n=1 Tax=Aphanizomenon flos-aquae FACHB-1040 TaxID=2692887 RepID=A0ABR8BWB5_APHFL|nr:MULTISPECIES: 3'-5' exonuclease [Nostocales]ALB43766.1 DNA polymerase III subunit epsilon [Anabaena sp. WA102]MBD2278926.1 3'-5' exonuclease [Aphanizomenon flos-aquae FACHB-1040]MBO1072899.1 3'-5' exonuclease [Dolichospermum sp. DEX189]MTJ22066.1 3'-5' exonuclease [Dolichospermum sp. UHCC 0352]